MKIRIASNRLDPLRSALTARVDVESAGILLARPAVADGDPLVVTDAAVFRDDAYLIREIDQLRLDPVAINRMVRKARDQQLSIFTVHTHPGATLAHFSRADDNGDRRLLPSFHHQVPGVAHGSIVIAAASGNLRARVWTGDRFDEDVQIVSVGERVRGMNDTAAADGEDADEIFARQRLALGAGGQRALARSTIGVVGLGGTGSVVAAQLAHLGVGKLVLVDGDVVERSNLSRVLGAEAQDVGRLKVDTAERYIRRLDTGTRVQGHGVALSDVTLSLLAQCDVILSCVDRHSPRALLNRMAYRSLAPVIDMGTAFRVGADGALTGDSGRVVVIGPGRPCLACWGALDPERLRIEALGPADLDARAAAGYIQGAVEHAPSVMPFNVMVAGSAVIEVLRLLTSFGAGNAAINRLSFQFRDGSVRRTSVEPAHNCRICGELGRERPAAGMPQL